MNRSISFGRALLLGLWVGLASLCLVAPAAAQNSTCPTAAPGDSSNKCASTAYVQAAVASSLALQSGFIYIGSTSNVATGVHPSGDCTISLAGIFTCTKTNGVAFAPSATTDATNAGNIGSGTLNTARLPAPFTSGTKSGSTSVFGTVNGTLTPNNCIKSDASGNLVDAGVGCVGGNVTHIELSGFSYYLGCNNLISCWVGFNASVFTNILNAGSNTKPVVVLDVLSELNITTGAFTPQVTGIYETRALMEGTSTTAQTLLSCGWGTSSSTQPTNAIVMVETQNSSFFNNSHMTPFVISLTGGTTYFFVCWASNVWSFNNLTVQSGAISPAPIIDFEIRRVLP